jgi:hypothetical protein
MNESFGSTVFLLLNPHELCSCFSGLYVSFSHPHLVPRSRINSSYISSLPKRLHGVWWDCFSFKYVICLLI